MTYCENVFIMTYPYKFRNLQAEAPTLSCGERSTLRVIHSILKLISISRCVSL